MGKIFFQIGAVASLILAIADANPWKLFVAFMFVMLTFQAFKAEESKEDI